MKPERGTIVRKVTKAGVKFYPVVSFTDPKTGRRQRKYHGGHRSRDQAEKALRRILTRKEDGLYVAPVNVRLGDWLHDWLKMMKTKVRPSTWESYDRIIRLHVLPRIGGVRLQHLDAPTLDTFYADLLEDGHLDRRGKRGADGGLSPRSVHYVHTILHQSLKSAVRKRLIVRNVALDADPPSQADKRPPIRYWMPDEAAAFLAHVRDDPFYPIYVLALTTGMRRGELLGLRWPDVNLDAGTVSIRQTLICVGHVPQFSEPKTKKGHRQIDPDPVAVDALRAWKKVQTEYRLAVGSAFADYGENGPLVFTKPGGALIDPEAFSNRFDRQIAASGVRRIRFHDLRHTFATIALASGVHVKVVSETLGHSTISITLDTYAHVIPGMGRDATGRVAGAIFGGQS